MEIKEAQAADPAAAPALAQLVELMATSRDRALAAQSALAHARSALATVPDGLSGQPRAPGRDDRESTKYGPLLDSYYAPQRAPASHPRLGRPAAVPGPDPEPRRAPTDRRLHRQLRIIAFDHGRDGTPVPGRVPARASLDFRFIKPPTELANYLLGPKQPWQLADANWSPDFPTSAQDAMRLYTNESGDTPDRRRPPGITTYSIDELLKFTGPITVPGRRHDHRLGRDDAQAAPADLGGRPARTARRSCPRSPTSSSPGSSASHRRSGPTCSAGERSGSQRLLLAWFKNPDDEAVAAHGASTARPAGSRRLHLSGRFKRRAGPEDQRDHTRAFTST